MANLNIALQYSGINFPGHLHTLQSMHYAEEFKFHDTDILIVTYPKSGTTWMQEILTLICSDGNQAPAKTIPNWIRTPWIEHYYCEDILQDKLDNRIITTHLPFHILSKSLKQSNTKVIYVARNPMDIVVSFYHFHKMAKFLPEPGTFGEFLEKFLLGKVHFGSWFEHIKDWLSHREEFNFLFITYEELKKDLRCSVEKLCKFLERSLLPDVVDTIVWHCSFTNMKDNQMINYTLVPNEIMDHQRGKFMRKGKVGDWKEHFTEEQKQHFEKVFQEKMRDMDIRFIWSL
ncbi:sulfotransferase family 5A, member 1 isoform X1 [Hemiscyllium ocellatum]|uniref:sulfotransferase family 5A, member 1 isoform X1 n=2 Tax=Hemiscyllium ocellatum TaxID=170820 RepID=UPI002965DA15|nr:sulfotransferase family 5A, member 1 isoform X1 [Hemiscyllium ocellatum]